MTLLYIMNIYILFILEIILLSTLGYQDKQFTKNDKFCSTLFEGSNDFIETLSLSIIFFKARAAHE